MYLKTTLTATLVLTVLALLTTSESKTMRTSCKTIDKTTLNTLNHICYVDKSSRV